MSAKAATQPKVHRRPILRALWSPALIASARQVALHLHDGRPKISWDSADGFVERRATVRGAVCVECGQLISRGTLALYAFTGDKGRTPYPRYLHIERCSGGCSVCGFVRCQCWIVRPHGEAPARPTPEALASKGMLSPDSLTREEIREICRSVLKQERHEGAA